MRPTIAKTYDLFAPTFDHEFSKELEAIDAVVAAHPEWARWVHGDLVRGIDAKRGRRGMSAAQVLRVVVLQRRLNLSLRKLSLLLADSLSMREFLGLGLGDEAPKRGTLQENVAKVQPETWGKLLRGLTTSAEAQEYEAGDKVRVDATVTKTNVHQPSDSSLLWDSIRVLMRLLKRTANLFALEFEDHSKSAKKLHHRIFYARTADQRKAAYEAFLGVSRKVDVEVVAVLTALRKIEANSTDDWALRDALVEKIEHYRALFLRIIDQTSRRVIQGETVPAAEKVLSIFEPHTDVIVTGNRSPQYGHKLTLTIGETGLVLDCVVERGNPTDVTLTVRQLERQKKLFGRAPHTAAFDGGFASRENFDRAKALGVERCAFSKGRGLTPEEMAGNRRTYGRLRNFRAGIEAYVSFLKRAFGLDRCTWKGWARFKAYVWSAVFA